MEFQLFQARDILGRTPATLHSLLDSLPDEWLYSNEGPDTWSPFHIVGHLVHGEETDWIPRAKIILEYGETRPFEPFERDAMFEKSRGKSISDLLTSFDELREQNLIELDRLHLTETMLEKRGSHPELGTVTLRQLISTWVVHDLGHLRQIVRVMAKQYDAAVGPWRAYLNILRE